MKTTPMAHQIVGLDLLAKHDKFLLACEQGTGKTWMLMADAEAKYQAGLIDGVLVIAPNGVHTNWVLREIPLHMSVTLMSAYYFSGCGKKHKQKLERLFAPLNHDPALRILAISIDAINTKNGFDLAWRFLTNMRCMIILDESSRIKNPSSKRTERCINLSRHAEYRRAASGTPITQSPADAFSQFDFLDTGLLGTTSYRSFAAEYTQMLPPNNRLVLDIVARRHPILVERWRKATEEEEYDTANDLLRQISRYAPLIAATDSEGKPRHRNLDKLAGLMAPHMYRVTKKECLDLPEKIYSTQFFELSPRQRAAYDFLKQNLRWENEDGELDTYSALVVIGKLQQITSGFIMNAEGEPRYVEEEATPRLAAMMELIEDIDGKFIVWARYKEEIRSITAALRAAGIEYVEYHGGVNKNDRDAAIEALQVGQARAFVGNAQSGGIGLTLTKAETVIYYSNTFNLEERLQSEDRAHRIGTVRNVNYIDMVAADTVDEKIALALQTKEELATVLLRDRK